MAFCLSTGTTMASHRGNHFSAPSASLSRHVGLRTGAFQLRTKASATLLHCSFTPSPSCLSLPSRSSFSGLSLGFGLNSRRANKKRALVVYASRFQLCQTKRNASRKSLAGVHGFRKRMSTTTGRAVLQRRRAKGRWVLCTKTNCYRGKRV